jgi:hypothetical protein
LPNAGSGGSGGKGGTAGNAGSAGKGGSAGSGGTAGNGGTAGSGGTAGNGGSAGKGGTAGSGGTGNGGSAGNAGSAGSGGASCVDNTACNDSDYCSKPSCGAVAPGHCAPRPASCTGTKQATVCGCDGITYHDSCLLHSNGQNSSGSGECAKADDGTLGCSSSDELACTAKGGVCAYKAELGCAAIPTVNKGVCWILPATCPGADDQSAHSCSAEQTSCTSECLVIKSRQNYTLPATCN